MAGGGIVDQAAWRAARERRGAWHARRAQGAGGDRRRLGGVTKDLGLGLVDFLHLRDGREVNLCWRYGEERITHWHGLDEGYARAEAAVSRATSTTRSPAEPPA